MALQLGKHFLAQTGGDLGVNPRVLDILVPYVICHVLNAPAGLQEVHDDGMSQAMDGSSLHACLLGLLC